METTIFCLFSQTKWAFGVANRWKIRLSNIWMHSFLMNLPDTINYLHIELVVQISLRLLLIDQYFHCQLKISSDEIHRLFRRMKKGAAFNNWNDGFVFVSVPSVYTSSNNHLLVSCHFSWKHETFAFMNIMWQNFFYLSMHF